MNPYYDANVWEFMGIFFRRLFLWEGGLPSDELQIWTLGAVSTSTALLGTLLVLRKMTMVANALSHTILLGIVGAFLLTGMNVMGGLDLTTLLIAAFVMGILTTLSTDLLIRVARLQEDASIGLVFNSLFALGVVVLTLMTRDAHIGTEVVMGNVDALQKSDLRLMGALAGVNLFLIGLFFKEFNLTTFDPGLAHSMGYRPALYSFLLMILVSLSIVAAFRAVGALLVIALIVIPPLTARFWTRSLLGLMSGAIGVGWLGSFVGVALSRHFLSVQGKALSTGGIVVVLLGLLFLLSALIQRFHYLRIRGIVLSKRR